MKFTLVKAGSILVFILCAYIVKAQSEKERLSQKIETYKIQDSLVQYLSSIDSLNQYFKNFYGKNNIDRFKYSHEMFSNNKIYREPSNKDECKLARKYYSSFLYSHFKLFGQNEEWKEKAEAANLIVWDEYLLDDRAWYIENQIGHYYAQKNDYDKALHFYLSIIPGLKQRNRLDLLARCYSDIANCFAWKGNNERAVEYFEKGLSIGLELDEEDAINANLGKLRTHLLKTRNFGRFLSLYQLSQKRLQEKKTDPNYFQRLSSLNMDYGSYLLDKGIRQEALSFFRRAKDQLKHHFGHDKLRYFSKIDLEIAKTHLTLNEFESARVVIDSSFKRLIPSFQIGYQNLPDHNQIYDENTLIDLLQVKSIIYENQYQKTDSSIFLDSILMTLDLALEVNRLLKTQLTLSESKLLSTSEHRDIADISIKNLHRKYILHPEEFDFTVVRNVLNVSKSQIVNDQKQLNRRISKLPSGLRNLADSLQNDIYYKIRERESCNQLDSLNLVIFNKREQLKYLLGEAESNELSRPVSENFIEYHAGLNYTYLFSELMGQSYFLNIGPTLYLDSLLDRFSHLIKKRTSDDGVYNALSMLGAFLIPDELQLPKSFSVVVDGNLSAIPFDALLRDSQYLIMNHEIDIQQHFNISEGQAIQRQRILGLAPTYNINDSIYSPLVYNQKEINSIRSDNNGEIDLISKIGLADLITKLEDYNIFHFAGHALYSNSDAYLVLNDGQSNIKWKDDEISCLDFDLDLVTLSACETGLGTLRLGDGVNSLSRGFLASGVQSVVYSIWAVNDLTTSELMNYFYINLNKGVPIKSALRKAKLDFIKNAIPEKRNPYYWAGFMATGNTEISTVQNSRLPLIIFFSLIILILVLSVLIQIKHTQ